MTPRILIVAPAQMTESAPDGFAPRYVALIRALHRVATVAGVFHVPLPTPPTKPGARARAQARVGLHRGSLPRFSHPYDEQAFAEAINAHQPDSVVVLAPYLAHIALAVPQDLPVVVALEECLERSIDYEQSHVGALEARVLDAAIRRRSARLYRAVHARCALIVFISQEELVHFVAATGSVTDTARVIPHGIDTQYYQPAAAPSKRYDVVVFGRLASPRNAPDALATHAASRAMPGGERLRWAFVGPAPHPAIQELAGPDVDVIGEVPDIRPYVQSARVALCPSSRTTGVKTTLLQALAMGVPTVAHVASTSGLAAGHERILAVGDDPIRMAEHLVALASDEVARQELAELGVQFVREHHDITAAADRFAKLVLDAVTRAVRQ